MKPRVHATTAPSSAPEVVTTREAAEMLGVAVRTAQLWVESGVLRAWKTAGGHRRIARESVEALLAARAASIGAAGPDSGRADPEFRILVVEDDPALRKLFDLTLNSLGLALRVATAENGFAGLIQLGNEHPDLLITDLNMPGMDGFRMIRHLRDHEAARKLEIVVVTALGRREIDARGGLPVDIRVFAKPVPFADLETLIRNRIDARNRL